MQNIRETLIIGPRCVERFVPLTQRCTAPLREARVVMAGVSDLEGRYEVDRDDYPYHVVIFTLAGAATFSTPETTRRLSRGDLLVAPAGARFGYRLAARTWRIAWFHLERREPWQDLKTPICRIRRSHLCDRIHEALVALLAEARDSSLDAQRAARVYSELLALQLRREVDPGTDPVQREIRGRFAALWEAVNDAVDEPWSVRELARRFGASPAHFHRLCLEECALSPKRVVFRLRMLRAAELLSNTSRPLKDIAPQVGYDGAFALSAAFKRYFGASPKQYKRRAR
jgi:transcriptional regulator GlxA family with amidase domain